MDDIRENFTNFDSKLNFLLNIHLHSICVSFQTRIVTYNTIHRNKIGSLKKSLVWGLGIRTFFIGFIFSGYLSEPIIVLSG